MRRIARLGIALIGFWILTYVPNLLTYASGVLPIQEPGKAAIIIGAFMPSLAAVLIGLLLVANRNRLADQLFDEGELEIGTPGTDLVRAGLALLGVSMIASAVLGALSTGTFTLGRVVQERLSLGDIPYASGVTILEWLPSVLTHAVRLAIGLFLVLRAETLAHRLWLGKPAAYAAATDLPRCPQCDQPYDPDDYVGGTSPSLCVECGAELTIPSHLTSASS